MMRLRSLALLLMCALASACASTGHRTAETATLQDAPVIAGDVVAADTSAASAAGDVEPPAPATPAIADATPSQDADATTGDAEADFAAIYGQQAGGEGTPIGSLGAPAAYDPWEKYNRRVHAFNMAVDRGLAKPLARAYVAAVPRPLRTGVSNFFDNLGQPVTLVNSLLQGIRAARRTPSVVSCSTARSGSAACSMWRPRRRCQSAARISGRPWQSGAGSARAIWNSPCWARARCAT